MAFWALSLGARSPECIYGECHFFGELLDYDTQVPDRIWDHPERLVLRVVDLDWDHTKILDELVVDLDWDHTENLEELVVDLDWDHTEKLDELNVDLDRDRIGRLEELVVDLDRAHTEKPEELVVDLDRDLGGTQLRRGVRKQLVKLAFRQLGGSVAMLSCLQQRTLLGVSKLCS